VQRFVETEGAMISTYRLKHPVRAVLHESENGLTLVTLPAGAVLTADSNTVRSMVWQSRHYSITAEGLQEADYIPQQTA
jgi:putative hemolysin